jgi:hypothetical protein
MKFEELKFKATVIPMGIQAIVDFNNDYRLSIIKNSSSYGNQHDLYEIAVFQGQEQVEMPGITQEGDTVKGYLTEANVEDIIKKMSLI